MTNIPYILVCMAPWITKYLLPLAVVGGFSYFYVKPINVTQNGKMAAVQDDGVNSFYGAATLENETLETLDVYGPATLKNITLYGPGNVYGPATIQKSNINDMNIYGVGDISDTKSQDINIYGAATFNTLSGRDFQIYGSLDAENLDISGEVIVYGTANIENSVIQTIGIFDDTATLKNVTAKDITMTSTDTEPTLTLSGSTSIETITFDKKFGHVVISNGKPTHAKIINGKVKQ